MNEKPIEAQCPKCGHWQPCEWIQHPTRAIGVYDWMNCDECGETSSVESECEIRRCHEQEDGVR